MYAMFSLILYACVFSTGPVCWLGLPTLFRYRSHCHLGSICNWRWLLLRWLGTFLRTDNWIPFSSRALSLASFFPCWMHPHTLNLRFSLCLFALITQRLLVILKSCSDLLSCIAFSVGICLVCGLFSFFPVWYLCSFIWIIASAVCLQLLFLPPFLSMICVMLSAFLILFVPLYNGSNVLLVSIEGM